MRIALCTDQYLPMLSGVADSVALLAEQLIKSGHEVRIYTLSVPGAAPDKNIMRFRSYSVPGSGGGLPIVLPFGAMKDIKKFKPDVIHTHLLGVVGIFAWYASRRLRVPLVGTDHTFPADYLHYVKLNFEPFRWGVRRLSSWYYNRCVYVTGPSQQMLDELSEYHCIRSMQIVPNHIPSHIFRPLADKAALKAKFGIGPQAIVIFGRITVEKNLAFALDIFADVAKSTVVELVFVGDGIGRPALEQKVQELKLEGRVHFLGTLRGEQLVEAINACDVLLITSLSETQSMSTLQAMATGLPVVAVKAGGLPDYVFNDINGYCIDSHNKKEFSDKLIELVNNKELAKKLGEQGRESVAKYSPEAITKQFEAIYQTSLSKYVAK